jgi:cytochrome b involved in lipid metabolism
MKKLVLFSTFTFVLILLSGCMNKDQDVASQDTVITGETTMNTTTGETNTSTMVGDDKDEHGCIASAGYTRNEAKQECTKSREDNQTTGSTNSTKTISILDIAQHKTPEDCRTAINGIVYNVTAFFGKHPGGDKNLFRVCGIDATEVFNKKHGNDPKANNVLAGFEIGTLTQ